MASLSRQVIESIAERMTAKTKMFVEGCFKEYRVLATELYEQKIPESIKVAVKSHPEYFNKATGARLKGPGFSDRTEVNLTKSLVSNTGDSYRVELHLTEKQAESVIKLKIKWEKAKAEY